MIRLTFGAVLAIRDHIQESPTREAGGLLFGGPYFAGSAINLAEPMANEAGVPEREFSVDPYKMAALVEDRLEQLQGMLGTFHSHPNGPAIMSREDAALAQGTGLLLIVGTGGVWDWAMFDPLAGGQVPFEISPPCSVPCETSRTQ